jgi:hypothetical protein
MNAIITLLIYWSIAVGLIAGGLFALAKGFRLVLEGKGKHKEESKIELFGLKVSVSSIGSLVMITAFMWGWAAKLALPSYKDQNVEIHALKTELSKNKAAIDSLSLMKNSFLAQLNALKENQEVRVERAEKMPPEKMEEQKK